MTKKNNNNFYGKSFAPKDIERQDKENKELNNRLDNLVKPTITYSSNMSIKEFLDMLRKGKWIKGWERVYGEDKKYIIRFE